MKPSYCYCYCVNIVDDLLNISKIASRGTHQNIEISMEKRKMKHSYFTPEMLFLKTHTIHQQISEKWEIQKDFSINLLFLIPMFE